MTRSEPNPPQPDDYLGVPHYLELHPADPRRDSMTGQPDTLQEAIERIEEHLEGGFQGTAVVFAPSGDLVAHHDGTRWITGGPKGPTTP